jgi:hypothetical protein
VGSRSHYRGDRDAAAAGDWLNRALSFTTTRISRLNPSIAQQHDLVEYPKPEPRDGG